MLSKCLKERKWHGLQRKNLMLIVKKLDKAVACDTNVAIGSQEKEIRGRKHGKKLKRGLILKIKKSLRSRNLKDQEIFKVKKSLRSRNLKGQEIFKIKKSSDQSLERALGPEQRCPQRKTSQKVFLKSSMVWRRQVT